MTSFIPQKNMVIIVAEQTYFELEKEMREQFALSGNVRNDDMTQDIMLGGIKVETFPMPMYGAGFMVVSKVSWNQTKERLKEGYKKELLG